MTANQIMQYYDNFPTNTVLSAGSGVLAFIGNVVDPVYTAIVLPVLFFAVGKGVDVAVKIWLDNRKAKKDGE